MGDNNRGQYLRDYQKRTRYEAEKRGLCNICKKNKADDGFKTCLYCRQRTNENYRKRNIDKEKNKINSKIIQSEYRRKVNILLKEKGVNKCELARYLNMDRKQLSMWLCNKMNMSLSLAEKVYNGICSYQKEKPNRKWEDEEWRTIQGYQNKYMVSNYGRVWNLNRNEEKRQYMNKKGYMRVSFMTEGKRKDFFVHRLVAFAFIPKVRGKEGINHLDGKKANNHVDNLEWTTQKENVNHAIRIGLHKIRKIKAVEEDKEYFSAREYAKTHNVTTSSVYNAISRNRRIAGNHIIYI